METSTRCPSIRSTQNDEWHKKKERKKERERGERDRQTDRQTDRERVSERKMRTELFTSSSSNPTSVHLLQLSLLVTFLYNLKHFAREQK